MIASNVSIESRLAERAKLFARFADQVPSVAVLEETIASFTPLARALLMSGHLSSTVTRKQNESFTGRLGRWFCEHTHLSHQEIPEDFTNANTVTGFVDHLTPKICSKARRQGMRLTAIQNKVPAATELRDRLMLHQRYPDWSSSIPIEELQFTIRHEEIIWSQLDYLACPSEYIRNSLLEQGVAADYVQVLPTPIDCEEWDYIDRSKAARGAFTVGFAGSVNLMNGLPVLAKLAECMPMIQFVITGSIEMSIKAIDLPDNLTLTGKLSNTELKKQIATWDVGLFPGFTGNSSTLDGEAMATGLPIVATHAAGTIIRHSRDGYICATDDISELVHTLRRLQASPELRRQMGQNARTRAEELNLESYASGWSRLFNALAEEEAA